MGERKRHIHTASKRTNLLKKERHNMSFNKVILIGNFTRDPELRQTQSGTSICRFSIALNRSYEGKDANKVNEACFVEVDSFGRSAENIAKFFTKGSPILIEGRLRQESWTDKESGKQRSKLLVVLERFGFVGSKNSDGASDNARAAASADELEDDLPF